MKKDLVSMNQLSGEDIQRILDASSFMKQIIL